MEKWQIDDMLTNLQSYLETNGIDTRKFFRCVNPEHIDNNASMKYFDDNKVYCFGCGVSYNLIDCISALEHLDKKEAFKKAINTYYGKQPISRIKRAEKPKIQADKGEQKKNYDKAFAVWKTNYKKSKLAQDYVANRGIDNLTAERFNLGFNTFTFGEFSFNAVIIPISENCFTARNIVNNNKIKHYKPKGCNAEIFNIKALNNDTPFCVITEGEFDALSFESVGKNALALCSANNTNNFIKMQNPLKTYILALDNDVAGQKATERLIENFNENNIKYYVFDNCGFKDANEALTKNKELFTKELNAICEKITHKSCAEM